MDDRVKLKVMVLHIAKYKMELMLSYWQKKTETGVFPS